MRQRLGIATAAIAMAVLAGALVLLLVNGDAPRVLFVAASVLTLAGVVLVNLPERGKVREPREHRKVRLRARMMQMDGRSRDEIGATLAANGEDPAAAAAALRYLDTKEPTRPSAP